MITEPIGVNSSILRALVADDDPVMRALVASRIAPFVDETIEAEHGLAAWQRLRSGNVNIALIDLSMPTLDGFGVLQCARGHPLTRHMPIVVITGNEDRASIEQALRLGATSYIAKPIDWTLFKPHIEHLLRQCRTEIELRAELDAARRRLDAITADLGKIAASAEAIAGLASLSATDLPDPPTLPSSQLPTLLAEAEAISYAVARMSAKPS